MRSATSSSLRVCAASAICSANPRLFAAGPRSITIGALAVSARCRWLAPCRASAHPPCPARIRPPLHPPLHLPPASPCIPPCIRTSAPAPLHPHLCTLPTFKDTATTEGHRHAGVPERPRCTRTSGRRPPCPSLWEMAPQLTNGTGIQVPLVERGATTWQICAKWHR